MRERPGSWDRLASLITLVERAPGQVLGQTAIVKLPYLLEVLRGVDLGYDFQLYAYGPHDPAVLGDLGYAKATSEQVIRSRATDLLAKGHLRFPDPGA